MKNIRIFLGLVFSTLALISCASRSYTPPRSEIIEQAESQGLPAPSLEEDTRLFYANDELNKRRLLALIRARANGTIRDTNYRLGAGDEVEVAVFDVPELNVAARVRDSGFLSLPLIGAVEAKGKTESELVERISERLRTYVKNPQVNVFISHYGSQKVAVMGAVDKPGSYSLKKGANSLLEVISEAGGLKREAGSYLTFIPAELSGLSATGGVESRARLALASQSQNEISNNGIEVYLDQVFGTRGGIPLEVPVRGGDMIVIPNAGQVTVDGEVVKRGSYDLGPNSTLLNALAAAGGITYGAKVDEVEVVRDVGADRKAHLILDLTRIAQGEDDDVRLRDGDIVRVPSDSGKRLSEDVFNGISRIVNVGVGASVPVN